MLVLTRKKNEAIQIGDGITVMVTRISGKYVQLGVTAPPEVRISRTQNAEQKTFPKPAAADRRECC